MEQNISEIKKWIISQIELSPYLETPIMDFTVHLNIKDNNLGIYTIEIDPKRDKQILKALKKRFPDKL